MMYQDNSYLDSFSWFLCLTVAKVFFLSSPYSDFSKPENAHSRRKRGGALASMGIRDTRMFRWKRIVLPVAIGMTFECLTVAHRKESASDQTPWHGECKSFATRCLCTRITSTCNTRRKFEHFVSIFSLRRCATITKLSKRQKCKINFHDLTMERVKCRCHRDIGFQMFFGWLLTFEFDNDKYRNEVETK